MAKKTSSPKLTFIVNAEKIAREEITDLGHPALADKFATVIRFLENNPDAASKLRKKIRI